MCAVHMRIIHTHIKYSDACRKHTSSLTLTWWIRFLCLSHMKKKTLEKRQKHSLRTKWKRTKEERMKNTQAQQYRVGVVVILCVRAGKCVRVCLCVCVWVRAPHLAPIEYIFKRLFVVTVDVICYRNCSCVLTTEHSHFVQYQWWFSDKKKLYDDADVHTHQQNVNGGQNKT